MFHNAWGCVMENILERNDKPATEEEMVRMLQEAEDRRASVELKIGSLKNTLEALRRDNRSLEYQLQERSSECFNLTNELAKCYDQLRKKNIRFRSKVVLGSLAVSYIAMSTVLWNLRMNTWEPDDRASFVFFVFFVLAATGAIELINFFGRK